MDTGIVPNKLCKTEWCRKYLLSHKAGYVVTYGKSMRDLFERFARIGTYTNCQLHLNYKRFSHKLLKA